MNIYANELYLNDVEIVAKLPLTWEKLKDKTLVISGGTGMIGSFLVDVIMLCNSRNNLNTSVYVLGRSKEKYTERFKMHLENPLLNFIELDINTSIESQLQNSKEGFALAGLKRVDYVIHGASNTHPMAYSTDPIGTITSNVIGTNNLLGWANSKSCSRFVFLSSVEVYGENRGDTDKFDEKYLGYIDCNTVRAGYPESKRAGEALCQAYIKQHNMDIVIPRLSRVYGPTMLMSDTKALSQFIKKSVSKEDIVLKSEGNQLFSYSYVGDAVSAILKIMFHGICGEAYNVVSKNSDIRLKDLAKMLADMAGTRVIFELPKENERAGYSTATVAVLDGFKLYNLGWSSLYDIEKGLYNTVRILRG